MKSVSHVFEVAVSLEVRKKSVHTVCKKKRKSKIFKEYKEDEERAVRDSEYWITHYFQINHKYLFIYEGTARKVRRIVVPAFRELTVQHCIVEALKPLFRRGMYKHTYAAIPKWRAKSGNKINDIDQLIWDLRGAHAGKKVIEKWLRTDRKNTKYVLKMDIRHFFESIDHELLKEKFRKYVHDERMLDLIYQTIDIVVDGEIVDRGLPLGFDTSHWYANWYLQDLDHFIKEELRAVYYIRYMDDMVIFGSNKRKLHRMKDEIERYLKEKLDLELKGDWQVFRFVYKEVDIEIDGKIKHRQYGRDLDFMGFRFYRNRTAMRKSIMLRATRKAKKISKKDQPTIYDTRQMASYNSYLKSTDTYNVYEKYIKPYVSMKKMRQKISRYDKNHRR